MSLFNKMFQTLSQVAVQEANTTLPDTSGIYVLEDIDKALRNLPCLDEEESIYPAQAVLIKGSPRLNTYFLEMEDLQRYMITNRIDNAKQAVINILEANGLEDQYDHIAIVIDEHSMREEMEELGYAVSGAMETPPKGLGLAMVGRQEDFAKIRRIANSKHLMDVLTGRYGLPLIKKNYRQVGLLEAVEDVQIKKNSENDQVIHESEPKNKKKNTDDGSDNEAERTEQPGDEDAVHESSEITYDQMSEHERRIQYLKDVAKGRFDSDLY